VIRSSLGPVSNTALGENTAPTGIQRLVANARPSPSRAQALAERATAALIYFASVAGLITFVVWSLAARSMTPARAGAGDSTCDSNRSRAVTLSSNPGLGDAARLR
jgi:cation transport ATPase